MRAKFVLNKLKQETGLRLFEIPNELGVHFLRGRGGIGVAKEALEEAPFLWLEMTLRRIDINPTKLNIPHVHYIDVY